MLLHRSTSPRLCFFQGEGGEQGDPLMSMQSGTTPRTGGHRQKSPSDGDFDGILGCVRGGDPGGREPKSGMEQG